MSVGDVSRPSNLLDESHFLEFFEETPAKRVDQEEHHGIIVVEDRTSNMLWQGCKSTIIIARLDEVGFHTVFAFNNMLA